MLSITDTSQYSCAESCDQVLGVWEVVSPPCAFTLKHLQPSANLYETKKLPLRRFRWVTGEAPEG